MGGPDYPPVPQNHSAMKSKNIVAAPSPATFAGPKPAHSQIADRAYDIWLKAGCPENCAAQHWLEAERQLTASNFGNRALHDDASRLSASPLDPAVSEAAELEDEVDRMIETPSQRSSTSL